MIRQCDSCNDVIVGLVHIGPMGIFCEVCAQGIGTESGTWEPSFLPQTGDCKVFRYKSVLAAEQLRNQRASHDLKDTSGASCRFDAQGNSPSIP